MIPAWLHEYGTFGLSAGTFGLIGYMVKRWVDKVDNSLTKINESMNLHLLQEEGFRGELEGIKRILADIHDIREAQITIIKEQARVRSELDQVKQDRDHSRTRKNDYHD